MARRHGPERAETVLARVHMLSARIGRAFRAELEAHHGLSVAEWRVVMTLARSPGAAAAEIAAQWGMDKMMVNRAIRGLSARGHVRGKPNAHDRRRRDLALTPKGRRLHARVLPDANARYREILAPLGKAERAAFRHALDKLLARSAELGG